MKLSQAQLCFLAIAAEAPYRTPFTGGRNAGRVASGWFRTAASLSLRGFVHLVRSGDAQVAMITDAGREAYAAASRGD
jgi:hypothetical protein